MNRRVVSAMGRNGVVRRTISSAAIANEDKFLSLREIQSTGEAESILRLGLSAATPVGGADFALLDTIMHRSCAIITDFSPLQLSSLIGLYARHDFVDSKFIECLQNYLPGVISSFPNDQYPQLFASLLRLTIDQPVNKIAMPRDETVDKTTFVVPSSPLMMALVEEIVSRVSEIHEAGCLMMLHAIVRRPRSRITPEMERLAKAISGHPRMGDWSIPVTVQAVHALSRLGIRSDPNVATLFQSITSESVKRIPSANLQQLLSIIHNHGPNHPPSVWRPVLTIVSERMAEPVVARSMQLSTLAVTLSYLGRFGEKIDSGVFSNLLTIFFFSSSKKTAPVVTPKLVARILCNPLLDLAHLTGILEAVDKLGLWGHPVAGPAFLLTRTLAMMDGLHNVRAVPICQLLTYLLHSHALLPQDILETETVIETTVAANLVVSNNWSLKTALLHGPDWKRQTTFALLEALLRHELFIKGHVAVTARCVEIRRLLGEETGLVRLSELPVNVLDFLKAVDKSPFPES